MNYYPNYNPYFGQQIPQQPIQRIQQPITQPMQSMGLQGKSVDSIEVVKAMDIPLDGSISYFPLTNGTAIVTKQLQMDGTSRTVIYEPIKTEDQNTKQITIDELTDLKENVNNIKLGLESLSNDLKQYLKEVKPNE